MCGGSDAPPLTAAMASTAAAVAAAAAMAALAAAVWADHYTSIFSTLLLVVPKCLHI